MSSGMNYGKFQDFTSTNDRSLGPSRERPPAPEPSWAKTEGLKSPPMRNIKGDLPAELQEAGNA